MILLLWLVCIMVASSVASGAVGALIMMKRISSLCGSISHTILSGMGFCLWLQKRWGYAWADPVLGALISGILAAWWIGYSYLRGEKAVDSLTNATWAMGTAIGVLFLSTLPNGASDIVHIMFGNPLFTTAWDLFYILLLDLWILGTLYWKGSSLFLVCLDEDQARLREVKVDFWHMYLLTLASVTIVTLVYIMGSLLLMALLTLPAMSASSLNNNLPPCKGAMSAFSRTILYSILLCSTYTLGGLMLSYCLACPPGACIALLAALLHLLTKRLSASLCAKDCCHTP